MAIHLPERTQTSTESLTPRQIVIELDRHVVGQHKAKRAVERPDTPAKMEPTFNRGSGCWWLWLIFTGINVCW